MKLTKAECDRLEPKEKSYKKFDGGGLYIEVTPKGSKLWRIKYYYLGKEKRLSLGKYPIVTLKKAREKRNEIKRLLDDGIDPLLNRKKKIYSAKFSTSNTFEQVAREWHTKQSERLGKKRYEIIIQRLEDNIFPYLGDWPISDIKAVDLLVALQKIENKGAYYVAKSTRQICGQVFKYGVQTSRCEHNPAPMLYGALKSKPVEHLAALEAKNLPQFIKALNNNKARLFESTRNAIWFSMLTFGRPGEIRKARWQDIDFKKSQWVVPKEYMKSRRSHIVPLAEQTIQILRNQQVIHEAQNTPWVFPGRVRHSKPMSDGTVNRALKKLGYDKKMTAHGFRALARTTIREKLGYYPDVIEAQLAHKPLGPLGRAYDRAQFLDERKVMMQEWADYIDLQH